MKKSLSRFLCSGVLAATVVLLSAPAHATVACGNYQPGMLAFLAGASTRPAPCIYQGDRIAEQGPTYSGPAVIAPQPTYAPTPTAAGYPYVSVRQKPVSALAAEIGPVRKHVVRHATVKRAPGKRQVVNVKNELPPRKGKVQVVHARAEVRIYSPSRMDIRLYRK